MSRLGEKTLIQHLTDPESLTVLLREGLASEAIPSEDLRRVVRFATNYFYDSGMTKAPSEAVMLAEYEDLLSDHEIELVEPDDSIEWVIDDLKGSYVFKQVAALNKDLGIAMAESETADRVDVLNDYASRFVALGMLMEDHQSQVDVRTAMPERMLAYEARAINDEMVQGMRLGLSQVDSYTRGIHPGEMAILAAGPKVGKSFFMDLVAIREWQAGRTVVLFTLENSVDMTLDRIACLATNVSQTQWLHGDLPEEQKEHVQRWIDESQNADHPLHVVQPSASQRSVEAMVRQAQVFGADSILIDQLSFIEPRDERAPRHLQIREITHQLKLMISTGRHRMSCLVAHQINREGVKAADNKGYLEMYHLAEGSETERTADWVFGLYRSAVENRIGQAKFQTLASRRAMPRHFQLLWSIDAGHVSVRSEIHELDA